jgi:hypothetical protein
VRIPSLLIRAGGVTPLRRLSGLSTIFRSDDQATIRSDDHGRTRSVARNPVAGGTTGHGILVFYQRSRNQALFKIQGRIEEWSDDAPAFESDS